MMMCWNNATGRKVQVDGEEPEAVSKFVYLGGTVAQEGDSDEDIKSRPAWKSQSSIQQA